MFKFCEKMLQFYEKKCLNFLKKNNFQFKKNAFSIALKKCKIMEFFKSIYIQ